MKYFKYFILTACATWLWATASVAQEKPPDTTAKPVAREESLVIIVHKSNPVASLTSDELRKLCLADRRHWSHGRKVTLALLEPGRPEREAVLRQVCQMTETEFTRHFLQGAFVGQVQSGPKELATGTAVRRFVFNVPGAIGFIRARDVDDTVKVVRLDGRAPSDPDYSLEVAAPKAKPPVPDKPDP